MPHQGDVGLPSGQNLGAWPTILFSEWKRVRFVDRTRQVLLEAGMDSRPYSGHSFHSGAATMAAIRGVQDSTIKMLGRWRSDAFQLYIKTPRHQLAIVSGRLSLSHQITRTLLQDNHNNHMSHINHGVFYSHFIGARFIRPMVLMQGVIENNIGGRIGRVFLGG